MTHWTCADCGADLSREEHPELLCTDAGSYCNGGCDRLLCNEHIDAYGGCQECNDEHWLWSEYNPDNKAAYLPAGH